MDQEWRVFHSQPGYPKPSGAPETPSFWRGHLYGQKDMEGSTCHGQGSPLPQDGKTFSVGEIEAAGYSSWFVNCLNSLRRPSGGQVLSWHLTDCPLCPKHGPETRMDPSKYKPLHDLVLGFNLDWQEVSPHFTDLPECTPQTWFSVIYERGKIAATALANAVAFLLHR